MSKRPSVVSLYSFLCSFFSLALLCRAVNTITKGQSIKDGETLISVDDNFELGFFSPEEDSALRYVGIWYHQIPDHPLIWVANRERPISDRNGVLTIGEDGNLLVRDGNGDAVWSSNASVLSNDTVAILETNGDLILSGSDDISDTDKAYWQSFKYPTDTYLPDMEVLVSSAVGENQAFTSWKSASDPSPGNFTMGVDPRGAPQIVIWENSRRRWRSGHWNSLIFTGVPSMSVATTYLYGFKLNREADRNFYFTYNPLNASDLMRFRIRWDGYEEQLKWNESENKWDLVQKQPANDCEFYNYCGNFGVCRDSESPKCSCMDGFEPRFPVQWSQWNWTGGCQRRSPLRCQNNASGITGEDGFKVLKNLKLPDFADVQPGVSMDTCRDMCLGNCSCIAFSIVNGIGCMTWSSDLIDVEHFDTSASTLFLRLAESEFDGRSRLSSLVIVIIVVAGVFFISIATWLLWRFKRKLQVLPATSMVPWMRKSEAAFSDLTKSRGYSSTDISGAADLVVEGSQATNPDFPLFNFEIIAAATKNFSAENKLGLGGFGPVYKGKLPGGEEIAVKRLSRISGQGLEEFKNEMTLIAKLQHRNLVRILGCCIEGDERMLVYEFMPNKSLDNFLFDPAKQAILDWRKRFAIIGGIARGLLYLHRDSRLRIIHRDLKASNILLDEDMNPKISDFGIARIFGGNQNEANTNRVVGTYGYMSPEYAMEGLFSVKSDVYSFGVLVLEIVSGRRNTSFRVSEHLTLVAYAWQLWSEGKALELVDPATRSSCSETEVLRCIQVGALCVQDSEAHRPTMASVLLMLESDTTTLPLPRQPTFTSRRASVDAGSYMDALEIGCSNDLTITTILGR